MHFGNKNKLTKTNEAMDVPPIHFNVPAAHVQTVSANKNSFKDFYKSNVPSFSASSMLIHKAAEYVKSNEGVRNKLYKDSKGKWTIGIGHLVTSDEFEMYREEGYKMGFDHVESGPLVRSSYHAEKHLKKN